MTRSSSSSSLEYINPTLLGRRPLYEQPQAQYVYYNAFHPATSAGPALSAAAAKYGVVSRGVPPLTPPTPPPRRASGKTRKKSSTRRASGTKKAPTIVRATSL